MNADERTPIAILGAGGFAEEIADLIEDIPNLELVAFVESADRSRCGKTLSGRPVLWIDETKTLGESCRYICSVGSPAQRKAFVEDALSRGLPFTTIIHPKAHVAPSSIIGEGCVIHPGVIVAARTVIGSHSLVNRGCLIGHHAEIGNFITVSPGANIAGRTRIGDLSYIGMASVILDGLGVGERSVVGSGALVTKNVPARVQVMGMPARITKENIEGR